MVKWWASILVGIVLLAGCIQDPRIEELKTQFDSQSDSANNRWRLQDFEGAETGFKKALETLEDLEKIAKDKDLKSYTKDQKKKVSSAISLINVVKDMLYLQTLFGEWASAYGSRQCDIATLKLSEMVFVISRSESKLDSINSLISELEVNSTVKGTPLDPDNINKAIDRIEFFSEYVDLITCIDPICSSPLLVCSTKTCYQKEKSELLSKSSQFPDLSSTDLLNMFTQMDQMYLLCR